MHINHWQEVKKNNLGKTGLILFGLIFILALFAPVLTPYAPTDYASAPLQAPSKAHLLGTNDVGQDILTRLFYGARTSLSIAIGVAFLSTAISFFVGATTALLRGWYEQVMMRLVDALLVIPIMILVIMVAAFIQPSLGVVIFILGILNWPGGARIIRAQTLTLKERTHVKAAQTFGATWAHILSRHILPDLGPILTANLIQTARWAIFMEAGISFLGLMDPAVISWGKMLYHSLQYIYLDVWQWWLLPIGISLSITILAFTFIGFALERAMNPLLGREKGAQT